MCWRWRPRIEAVMQRRKQWLEALAATANVAMNLNAHFQMALFQAALRLTFPRAGRWVDGCRTQGPSFKPTYRLEPN
jgi:hypothetical protein